MCRKKWGVVIKLKEYLERKFSGIIIVPKNNVTAFIKIYIIDQSSETHV
jgi:hypothetical protein